MTGITPDYDVRNRTLIDAEGEKIGEVEEVYEDQHGGQPEWARVRSGFFGTKQSFVPLAGAQPEGEDLRVTVTKDQVKAAPSIDAEGELTEDEEQQLFEHYGVPYTEQGSTTATGTAGEAGGTAGGADVGDRDDRGEYGRDLGDRAEGRDTSGPTTDEAMTRSEEELRVGTERRETGRVRLRKRVVTENVQTTVPLEREEVEVEREPITDANREAAQDGPAISEEEHEVVLHEERPVVAKEAVPKERVRLSKDTVTDEETVSDEVRKEQIETDDAVERR